MCSVYVCAAVDSESAFYMYECSEYRTELDTECCTCPHIMHHVQVRIMYCTCECMYIQTMFSNLYRIHGKLFLASNDVIQQLRLTEAWCLFVF